MAGAAEKCGGGRRDEAEIPPPPVRPEREVAVDRQGTALLVVDMQNDFVDVAGALHVPDARATVPAIGGLLALARETGMRTVFTKDTHEDGDPEWEIWPVHARRGSWGWEIVEQLTPLEGETVIEKLRYDAFYGTQLDHLLRLWGIDTVVICGTVANICVHYTAASAALRWYRVIIPRDAVSALDSVDMEASLRQTVSLFAGTVTTAAAIRVERTP